MSPCGGSFDGWAKYESILCKTGLVVTLLARRASASNGCSGRARPVMGDKARGLVVLSDAKLFRLEEAFNRDGRANRSGC